LNGIFGIEDDALGRRLARARGAFFAGVHENRTRCVRELSLCRRKTTRSRTKSEDGTPFCCREAEF
jgi:hypothetical protein